LPARAPGAQSRNAKQTKVFWFFFSKKNNKNKDFFLKKEAKTFAALARSRRQGRGD
jgi:hypothetical protein